LGFLLARTLATPLALVANPRLGVATPENVERLLDISETTGVIPLEVGGIIVVLMNHFA
jgi:hypothetical protein